MRTILTVAVAVALAWPATAQETVTLAPGAAVTVGCQVTATTEPAPASTDGTVTGTDLRVGETFLAHLSDFEYSHAIRKARMRSLLLADLNDTPDLALRRVIGTVESPTAVLPNELVGVLYWQPWGENGAYDVGLDSPYYGRVAQLHARAIGPQTATSRAGRLGWATGRPNDTVVRERGFVDEWGRMIVTGRASTEDNGIDSTVDTSAWGWLTVLAPRQEVGPALSMRFSTAPGYGFDFELNATNGSLELWSVRNGVRTRMVASWPF